MAARYRCEFVDLRDYHLDAELSRPSRLDLMFRSTLFRWNGMTAHFHRHRRSQQADDDR